MADCVLITGAGGEIGTSLINYFSAQRNTEVVALDLTELTPDKKAKCKETVKGSINDTGLLKLLSERYHFSKIFHLAGVLSSGGEKNPLLAHEVNVEGTLNLLNLAHQQSIASGVATTFIFPSTIAVYGIPSAQEKQKAGKLREDQYQSALTMYGINKLYCENLGRYFSTHFKMLAPDNGPKIDFRSVRLPGVISTDTLPSGGTSDYAPEMIHAAAQGKPYECFVRPDSQIPFMMMPDAIQSLIKLAEAPAEALTQRVYNVTSFSLTAEDFRKEVAKYFPSTAVTYKPSAMRQMIVDSWPSDIDDSAARRDWGWNPEFSKAHSFDEYLIPNISKRYGAAVKRSCGCA